jgi:hypothetical protein
VRLWRVGVPRVRLRRLRRLRCRLLRVGGRFHRLWLKHAPTARSSTVALLHTQDSFVFTPTLGENTTCQPQRAADQGTPTENHAPKATLAG